MIELFKIVACHLIGDYVLQTDYIAREKGRNWHILFVHCFLYCVPFAVVFGIDGRLAWIFAIHVMADTLKAREKKISTGFDQLWHYAAALIYFW